MGNNVCEKTKLGEIEEQRPPSYGIDLLHKIANDRIEWKTAGLAIL